MADELRLRCRACGAPVGGVARGLGGHCRECGRMQVELGEVFRELDEGVEYDFDGVSPEERVEASDLLVGGGIPFRWDSAYRLVVPADREADADELFGHDEVEDDGGGDGGAAGDGEVGDREVGDAAVDADADDVDGDEPEEWQRDERSAGALADLFEAADRLCHRPGDERAAADVLDAAGVVTTAPVPFGVNPVRWDTAAYLARQLARLLNEEADADDVVAGADAVRAVLRDHV